MIARSEGAEPGVGFSTSASILLDRLTLAVDRHHSSAHDNRGPKFSREVQSSKPEQDGRTLVDFHQLKEARNLEWMTSSDSTTANGFSPMAFFARNTAWPVPTPPAAGCRLPR